MAAVTLALIFGSAGELLAQGRYSSRNRSISRPAVSPYLELFRGGYGGYRGYGVSPMLAPYLRQNQSTASRVRDRTTDQSTSGGQSVNMALERARAARQARAAGALGAGAGTSGGVAPTGTGSVFMQYSHYYQVPQMGGGRRR